MRYKEFLLQVAKDWATDKVETDSDTDTARTGISFQTFLVPHEDSLGRLSSDIQKHVLEKIVGSEWGKENILLGGAMFVLPTKKEVKLGTCASSAYCHSTRGNVSRGTTHSSTTRVFDEYFLKISVHKNR